MKPILLAAAAASASAFAPTAQRLLPSSPTALHAQPTRRDATGTLGLGLLLALATSPAPSRADVLRAPGRCANGEGDGCADLAGDNELIKSLQQKSSENREANQRVCSSCEKRYVGWAISPPPFSNRGGPAPTNESFAICTPHRKR